MFKGDICQVQAIDVHGHFGTTISGQSVLINEFMTGDVCTVINRANLAKTVLTIVSCLEAFSHHKGACVKSNNTTAESVKKTDKLMQWVVVNPLEPQTYDQAKEMLKSLKCVGIKIHPEEHGYPINEKGREIFEFAEKHNTIVQTHSGEQKSIPEDFVPFCNAFPNVILILAHLGCGWDNDPSHQVRAIQASKHGNIYVDTSSAKNIMPKLIEWAVKEIGSERLLYGTDSPLYFAPMQRARIDYAEISDRAKRNILCENAVRLFGLQTQYSQNSFHNGSKRGKVYANISKGAN